MKSLFNVNDQKTEFKADYGQLLNYFKDTPKQKIAESFSLNHNRENLMSKCLNENPSLKGGTFNDIFKDVVIDTKQALDAKPQQNFVNKRKRFLSEHDGDYVHERRFDINFMESARREKVLGNNLIRINANADFDGGVSAQTINAYAKEVCEVVNYFEAMGKNVELNLEYLTDKIFSGAPRLSFFITVKRPDQYLSKADIYRAFSTLFFRHIGFACFAMAADINEKNVSSGLGTAVEKGSKIEVSPDAVIIHGYTTDLINKIKAQQSA